MLRKIHFEQRNLRPYNIVGKENLHIEWFQSDVERISDGVQLHSLLACHKTKHPTEYNVA